MRIHFIQHVPFEEPASIADWAHDRNHTTSITHIYKATNFPSIESIDMLVIMGGPMGAYDEDKYAWLKEEKAFIQSMIDADKRVLGICLGAQLIADVLHAKVFPHSKKEIGWFEVNKVNDHVLIKDLPASFTTFHWHGDTYTLPEGAIHLFSSEACMQQGFVLNKVAGLQFHPEVKKEALQVFTEHEKDELQKDECVQTEEEIIRQLDAHIHHQKKYTYIFMDNFIQL